MPFAHEILDDYDKVLFFDPFNSEELCESMIKIFSLEEKNLDKKIFWVIQTILFSKYFKNWYKN